MAKYGVQLGDLVSFSLTGDHAELRMRSAPDEPLIGDSVEVRFGLVTIYQGEVEGVLVADSFSTDGELTVFCTETSVASSCCMTSEAPAIEEFAARLREFLEVGGCCRGRLRDRKMLERALAGVFREADRLHGPARNDSVESCPGW